MRPIALVLLVVLAAAGCGHDDEGWLGCHGNYCVPALHSDCRVVDADLLCRLYDNFGVDVTGDARWSVTGPAVVALPGYIRTTGYGEIVPTAEQATTGFHPYVVGRYLADPPRAPRLFFILPGDVRDAGTKQALEGVRVTILDGYNAGRGATTNVRGSFTIDPVLTDETVTWQADKAGYEPATGRFYVPSPRLTLAPGAPQPPWRLDFEMARIAP